MKLHKRMTVKGQSMEPTIHSGDDVIVKLFPSRKELKPGDIVVIVDSSWQLAWCHRIRSVNDAGGFETQGDSKRVLDRGIDVEIVGLVIEILHKSEEAQN